MFDDLKSWISERFKKKGVTIPVVRVSGAIGMAVPLRPGVSLASLAGPLKKAFTTKKAPAVAILINSPGGSPVQSTLIFKRIRALAEENEKDVLVFVEDVAASGGYMIALAGDEIIADPSSIVGSIGVVSHGFGFVGLIDKLGIERRVHTAGTRKAILDAFSPEREEDVAHLKALQAEIHDSFIDMVKSRRGDILREDEDLFSGLFWTGTQARDFGLIDRLGDLRGVLRERFGEDVRIKLVSGERRFFWSRGGVGGVIERLGSETPLTDDLVSTLETRALWQRYGL